MDFSSFKTIMTAENLKKLLNNRGARKGIITRNFNEFNNKTNPTKLELESFIINFNKYKNEILLIDNQIVQEHDDLGDLNQNDYIDFLGANDAYILTVDQYIEEVQKKLNDLIKDSSNVSRVNNMNPNFKLPAIEIAPFSGKDKTLYLAFKEKFMSVIGLKPNLDDLTKFTYLIGFLEPKSPALELVQSLPIIASSYNIAIDTLDKIYLNPKEIQRNLATKLTNLKPVKCSYDELYKFYCELECLLGQIKNVGLCLEKSAWLIETILLDKLPPKVINLFQQILGTTYPELKDIRDKFPEILNRFNSTIKAETNQFNENKQRDYHKNNSHKNSKTLEKPAEPNKPNTLNNFNVNATSSNYGKCKFCDSEDHHSNKCDKYKDNGARIKRCQQLDLCTRCTGSGHNIKDCKSVFRRNCFNCGSRDHVSSLCNKLNGTSNTQKQDKSKSGDCKTFNSQLNLIDANNAILLPTITLKVKNCNDETFNVRALLDSCSQKSFVTNSLIKKLKITPIPENKNICVTSFVNNDCISSKYSTANIEILMPEKEIVLNAIIVNTVGQNKLHIPGLVNMIENLKCDYEIADKEIKEDTLNDIDILLGADYLPFMVQGLLKIGEGIALKTPFGIAPMGDLSTYQAITDEGTYESTETTPQTNNSDCNTMSE